MNTWHTNDPTGIFIASVREVLKAKHSLTTFDRVVLDFFRVKDTTQIKGRILGIAEAIDVAHVSMSGQLICDVLDVAGKTIDIGNILLDYIAEKEIKADLKNIDEMADILLKSILEANIHYGNG